MTSHVEPSEGPKVEVGRECVKAVGGGGVGLVRS
jgi:hypothetical protein